jgi:hypothetical protein
LRKILGCGYVIREAEAVVDVAVAWEDGSGVLTWGRGGGGWEGKRGARENDGLRTLDGKCVKD